MGTSWEGKNETAPLLSRIKAVFADRRRQPSMLDAKLDEPPREIGIGKSWS